MRVGLSIILIFLFGVVGYGIASNYIVRKKFFFEFNNFLDSIKSDIEFSSKKIFEILDEQLLSKRDRNFIQLLQNYSRGLKAQLQIKKDELFENITILTEQEKESIYIFLKRLGRGDVFSQTEYIVQIKNKCDEYYKSANEECKKYGGLYTKLGIILGALVALVIL